MSNALERVIAQQQAEIDRLKPQLEAAERKAMSRDEADYKFSALRSKRTKREDTGENAHRASGSGA